MLSRESVPAVAGLAAVASWSLLDRNLPGLVRAAVLLMVLLAVVRLIGRRDRDVRALRRAMGREHVLSELGTTLITTTAVADVYRHAVRAAEALLADVPGARAAVLQVDGERLTAVEATGADAEAVRGCVPAADAVPADLLRRLAAGETVVTTGPADRPSTLLPLLNRDRFFGVLALSADDEFPAELSGSLQALRTQVAPALDSVALTAELTVRALCDPLTGLGNRAMLRERLTAALARSRRTGRPVAALLLDLDGFKQVNDGLGHTAGDELLTVVAERLRDSVRTEDVLGRLGGDEFVVIAEELSSARDVTVIADRIAAALDQAVTIGGKRLRAPASIGIALSHSEIHDADELLRTADTAMYAAKRRGGGYQLHGTAVAVSS